MLCTDDAFKINKMGSGELSEDEKMKVQKKRVMQELIDTERAYVSDLRHIEDVYMIPMKRDVSSIISYIL